VDETIRPVPVDATLIDELREETLDAVREDYVSIGRLQSFAEDLSDKLTDLDVRVVVTEVLANLANHPAVKVVDADFVHTFATADEVRAHIDRTWPKDGRRPSMGEVAWVVKRDFVFPPRSDSAARPS
jgi:hypothetical protein